MIQYKIGNILDATEDAIAHQTNCVTYVAAGLAKSLFERFSYADCYNDRVKMDDPGTVTMCGGHDGLKTIINMHAQRYPGKPQYDKSRRNDGMIDRCTWFRQCLEQVIQLFSGEEPLLHSIAFPAGIGCGLAGGHWPTYLQELQIFEHMLKNVNKNSVVSVYALPQMRNLLPHDVEVCDSTVENLMS